MPHVISSWPLLLRTRVLLAWPLLALEWGRRTDTRCLGGAVVFNATLTFSPNRYDLSVSRLFSFLGSETSVPTPAAAQGQARKSQASTTRAPGTRPTLAFPPTSRGSALTKAGWAFLAQIATA